MTTPSKTLKRTAGKPLTTAAIAAMKAGQILADGGIHTGAGRLKIRKRQTKTGSVSEWLYIYWGGGKGKRVPALLWDALMVRANPISFCFGMTEPQCLSKSRETTIR